MSIYTRIANDRHAQANSSLLATGQLFRQGVAFLVEFQLFQQRVDVPLDRRCLLVLALQLKYENHRIGIRNVFFPNSTGRDGNSVNGDRYHSKKFNLLGNREIRE